MAEGNGHNSSGQKSKKKQKSKLDFDSLYEQLQTDNPTLIANKMFWTRKGSSQKYICTLCNISVQMSSNLNNVKTSILAHVEDKYHKKRYDVYVSKEKNNTVENKSQHAGSENVMIDQTKIGSNTNKRESILDVVQEAEDNLLSIENLQIHGEAEKSTSTFKENDSSDKLVDFDTVYGSFEKNNPVIKTSKQFITKQEDGRHFYCTLCKIMIFNSLNANEFRYNLWMHLNEESHREKLLNFSEVQKELKKVIHELSEALPSGFKGDLKFLEIGPVFRFVKCSHCEIAVSVNLHRLENHIRGVEHTERKKLIAKGKEKKEAVSDCTRNAFRKLVVRLEDRFKKDVKYIQIGKVPGYFVCFLCTYVIMPTQFYMQTHLESKVHMKNKTTSRVNRQSKFRVRLEDLMKTLPDDLKEYNIFEENMCGLTCKRCKESIPATSYDLYSHITKERHPFFK